MRTLKDLHLLDLKFNLKQTEAKLAHLKRDDHKKAQKLLKRKEELLHLIYMAEV